MARKGVNAAAARAGEAEPWEWPRYFVATCGLGPPNGRALIRGGSGSGRFVVVLHAPEDYGAAAASAGAESAAPTSRTESWMKVLPPVARSISAVSDSPPEVIIIMDISPLFASVADGAGASTRSGSTPAVTRAIDAEGADAKLGKGVGTQAARALERLSLQNATLVGFGAAAQLAMKLSCPGSNPRLRPDALSNLVLVHPRLPTATVNRLLKGKFSQKLAVVFDSEQSQERRLPMLQHAFPRLESTVCAEPLPAMLHGFHLAGFTMQPSALSSPLRLEPDVLDLQHEDGRLLYLSELHVELNPQSKQFQASVDGIGEQVLAALEEDVADTFWSGAVQLQDGNVGYRKSCASLIVRGSRCVLVRSLETPPRWKGMRIPIAECEDEETAVATARRAVVEMCDIDAGAELKNIEDVLPISMYMGSQLVTMFIFLAVHPPPPGPLEAADVEDEDDLYDWYTWPRALHALQGRPNEVRALHSAALTLANAAMAGLVPTHWGGVFGQEWTSSFMPVGDGVKDAPAEQAMEMPPLVPPRVAIGKRHQGCCG